MLQLSQLLGRGTQGSSHGICTLACGKPAVQEQIESGPSVAALGRRQGSAGSPTTMQYCLTKWKR